jgi:hypothetical protein
VTDDGPTDEEIAAAVVAVVASRSSGGPERRPLREPLSPWVASGWVDQPINPGALIGR